MRARHMTTHKLTDEISLDDTDWRLLGLLSQDSRITNQALSDELQLAPSTCLNRLKRLRSSGVIRRFTIDIDGTLLDRPLEALISVRLQPGARQHIAKFAELLQEMPEVTQYFFKGGGDDYLVHISVRDTEHARHFVVDNLSSNATVAGTQTSIVFDHVRMNRLS